MIWGTTGPYEIHLNRLLDEFLADLDVLKEFRHGRLEELLLKLVQFAVAEVLLNTVLAEDHRVGEVRRLC